MNEICKKCGLYKQCMNPSPINYMKPDGNENKVVHLFSNPSIEDDYGSDKDSKEVYFLKKVLDDNQRKRMHINYAIKCFKYKNQSYKKDLGNYTKEDLKNCRNLLDLEMDTYPDGTIIITYGDTAFKSLTGDILSKSKIGSLNKYEHYDGRVFYVYPNYSIKTLFYQEDNVIEHFKLIIDNAHKLNSDDFNLKSKTRLLNYQDSISHLEQILDDYLFGRIDRLTYDIETSSLKPWDGGKIIMVSFATDTIDYGFAIPFTINNYSMVPVDNLSYTVPQVNYNITGQQEAKLKSLIRKILNSIPLIGYNIKFDIMWSCYENLCDLRKVTINNDVYNACFQKYTTIIGPRSLTLKNMSRRFFNVTEDWDKMVSEYLSNIKRIVDKNYGNIPTGVLGLYAGLDTYYTHKLNDVVLGQLPDDQKNIILNQVNEAIKPVVDIEISGINFDRQTYEKLKVEYKKIQEKAANDIRNLPVVQKLLQRDLKPLVEANKNKKKPKTYEELVDQAFKFRNAIKIRELVYDKKFYGMEVPKNPRYLTPKKDPGTGKECIEYMLDNVINKENLDYMRKIVNLMNNPLIDKKKHELKKEFKDFEKRKIDAKKIDTWEEAGVFLKNLKLYRRMGKLLDDYLGTFPKYMTGDTYRAEFNINGTVTGRFSSAFHSMPNRCDIKRVVNSRWEADGGFIVACDYSQLELRIIASLANELKMLDAFNRGEDAHRFAASQVYNKMMKDITSEERVIGKRVNFAMVYGQTAKNLAETMKCSVQRAETVLQNFYMGVEAISRWKIEKENFTLEHGCVVTPFGRHIPIPGYKSKSRSKIAEVKRLAVNYSVQSPASDIVEDTMINVWHSLYDHNFRSKMIAQVHDSMEFDCYPGELFSLLNRVKKIGQDDIRTRFPWVKCPLRLDFEIGTSWGGAMECSIKNLDQDSCVLMMEGFDFDLNKFVDVASRAYDVESKIIKTEKFDVNKKDVEIVFYGDNTVEAEVKIKRK